MSDLEDIEDIFEGWLEKPTEDADVKSKGWLKKSFTKKWKKAYYVLRRYCAGNQPFVQWFDKEDGWRRQMPRGTLELFPRYKVFKRAEQKAKQYVFEISTDSESLVLAAESETIMDLWVIQLQMQTMMNPRIAGEVFRVKGSGSRQMQRIGARDQQCLLHISRWGLTLALERTRAVLAQWPLTTIRSYEALDANEFIFEAGRASPMGEGKYNFVTHSGDDNKIFDVIDNFTTARRRNQGSHASAGSSELTQDDIERAYDQLRFSMQAFSGPPFNRDLPTRNMNQSAPQSIGAADSMQGMYNHLGRSDSIGSAHSLGGMSLNSESNLSYNHLERLPSWGSQASYHGQRGEQYNRLNPVPSESNVQEGSYDRLARSPSTTSRTLAQSLDTRLPKEARPAPRELPQEPMPLNIPIGENALRKSIDDLTGSDEYPEVKNGKSKVETHSLPATAQQVPSHEESQNKARSFSRRDRGISMVGSPNFMYLNAAYSSSVEVLPYLYAQVDLSKKTKYKQVAETTSDLALARTRRKSKSSDSILSGSPSGSPTSTHFEVYAASDAESKGADYSFLTMIPPQKPHSESVARSSIVSSPDEEKAELALVLPELPAKKGTYGAQVEALGRTLSEMAHVTQKEKYQAE